VADLGLRTNPRQIKRLINSFLLLDRIVERRALDVDQELMAAMIGLQLRWPDHYRDLQDNVLADDEQPFEPLMQNEDKALARYSARFFGRNPGDAALRQLLQLTAVVASEPREAFGERPVREVQEERHAALVATLGELGFELSPQSTRSWYHAALPDFRLVLQKTGLRFEIKNTTGQGRPWQLSDSFDYRHSDRAIAALTAMLGKQAAISPT